MCVASVFWLILRTCLLRYELWQFIRKGINTETLKNGQSHFNGPHVEEVMEFTCSAEDLIRNGLGLVKVSLTLTKPNSLTLMDHMLRR